MTAATLCKGLFKCTDVKTEGDLLTLTFPGGRTVLVSPYHDNELVLAELLEACIESGTFSFESATKKMIRQVALKTFMTSLNKEIDKEEAI